MNEHPGFLQAIIERPDDDAPRLIYADWLDEQGASLRAEFIRLQFRVAQLTVEKPEPFRYDAEVLDSRDLRPEVRSQLLGPFFELGLKDYEEGQAGPDGPFGCLFAFRRGFVERLEVFQPLCAADFLRCAADVFRMTPLLHLHFSLWEIGRLGNRTAEAILRALVAAPESRRLRTLKLSGCALNHRAARLLLDSPSFGQGTKLIFESDVGPELRAALRKRFGDWLLFEGEIPF
jgi:uncharacterized protein (TIGR02996 family)